MPLNTNPSEEEAVEKKTPHFRYLRDSQWKLDLSDPWIIIDSVVGTHPEPRPSKFWANTLIKYPLVEVVYPATTDERMARGESVGYDEKYPEGSLLVSANYWEWAVMGVHSSCRVRPAELLRAAGIEPTTEKIEDLLSKIHRWEHIGELLYQYRESLLPDEVLHMPDSTLTVDTVLETPLSFLVPSKESVIHYVTLYLREQLAGVNGSDRHSYLPEFRRKFPHWTTDESYLDGLVTKISQDMKSGNLPIQVGLGVSAGDPCNARIGIRVNQDNFEVSLSCWNEHMQNEWREPIVGQCDIDYRVNTQQDTHGNLWAKHLSGAYSALRICDSGSEVRSADHGFDIIKVLWTEIKVNLSSFGLTHLASRDTWFRDGKDYFLIRQGDEDRAYIHLTILFPDEIEINNETKKKIIEEVNRRMTYED